MLKSDALGVVYSTHNVHSVNNVAKQTIFKFVF